MNNQPPANVNDDAQLAIAEKKEAQIAKVTAEYESLAHHIPDQWGQSKEEKLSLVKAIHTDILGVDKQGNPRPLKDLRYFLFQAAQKGLNPFKNQIHASYRWNSELGREALITVTGIDGFRSIAQGTGRYAGSAKAVYTHKDDGSLESASVVIHGYNPTTGAREEIAEGEAYYDEFVQTKKDGKPNSFWTKMPRVMLSKCAEAVGLRKAFPEQLGSMYIPEEMPEERIVVDNQSASTPVVHKKQIVNFAKPPVKESVKESEEPTGEVEENDEEIRKQITEMFTMLNASKYAKMKVINQVAKTPLLDNAKREHLIEIRDRLGELIAEGSNPSLALEE